MRAFPFIGRYILSPLVLSLVTLSSCGYSDEFTVLVEVEGDSWNDGDGTVSGVIGGGSINCVIRRGSPTESSECDTEFPTSDAGRGRLTAEPNDGSVFRGWGLDCSGTDDECDLSWSRSEGKVVRKVKARFDRETPPYPPTPPAPVEPG